MSGETQKISSKKSRAIASLLKEKTIKDAAVSVGIGEATLRRWMNEDDFQEVYRHAKKQIVLHAVTQLQNATGDAVCVLSEIMNDSDNSPSPRVTAARTILEMALKAVEIEELEARIEALEKFIDKR